MSEEVIELAKEFQELYRNRQYQQAKEVYDTATNIAVKYPDEEKMLLFGNRPYRKDYEEETEGLFPEWMVMEVLEMCIFGKKIKKQPKNKMR